MTWAFALSVPRCALAVFLLLTCVPGCSSRHPPSLSAIDLEGHPTAIGADPNGRAFVILFLGVECPISNRYLPELVALENELGPRGIRFFHVYPNPDETPEVIRRHRAEYHLPATAFRDPQWSLARTLGTSKTPEAVALTAEGRVIYHGRVNDQYAALGVGKPEPTRHDLAEALREFLKGAPPVGNGPPAVGCSFRALP